MSLKMVQNNSYQEELLSVVARLTFPNSVVGILKDYLRIDLTGVIRWLSFVFDNGNAKETQKVRPKQPFACNQES